MSAAESLEDIKRKIESMSKIHQIEILRILKNAPNAKLNENKSGVYVNLTLLPKESIDELLTYVKYTTDQEQTLNSIENQKTEFKNAFFSDSGNE
jgi:hypothetical protein